MLLAVLRNCRAVAFEQGPDYDTIKLNLLGRKLINRFLYTEEFKSVGSGKLMKFG
jgi:hypothetical protein